MMDMKEAGAFFQAHINKSIDAKLIPMARMMLGLELLVFHLFNLLHRKGIEPREASAKSLQALLTNLEKQHPDLEYETKAVILHVKRMLEETEDPANPDDIRAGFQLILGGLAETPPEGKEGED